MRQILLIFIVMTVAACATVSRHPIAGTWDITITSQRGENEGVIELREDLTGTLTGSRGRVTELSDITYEDGQFAFTMIFNAQGRELDLAFSGTVEGDSLQGVLITPIGESTAIGTRRPLE